MAHGVADPFALYSGVLSADNMDVPFAGFATMRSSNDFSIGEFAFSFNGRNAGGRRMDRLSMFLRP